MSKKLYIKDKDGTLINVTSDILSAVNINELEYLLNEYNHIEYAYIRTKTLSEIDSLIDVETFIDNKPININTMFYKKYDVNTGNVPYDPSFINVNRFNSTANAKDILFNKFQKANFIISAIYRENGTSEKIDDTYWTTQPQGVNDEYRYEWQIQRFRKMYKKDDGKYISMWSYFTYPILINSYYEAPNHLGSDSNAFWSDNDALYIKLNGNNYIIKESNNNLVFEKVLTMNNE
jgi:phosphoglycolate phosphatase-like HAD superfamily hydrolase